MKTIFEIRPHRGGWQCFETPGVARYWIGRDANAQALDYAKCRTTMRRGEIRILNATGEIEDTIRFDNKRQKV
jgi:hypothetical protein